MTTKAVALSVNGKARTVPAGTTVARLVCELAGHASARGVAVAIDREVVPRSSWGDVVLAEGTSVEVVTAVAGG